MGGQVGGAIPASRPGSWGLTGGRASGLATAGTTPTIGSCWGGTIKSSPTVSGLDSSHVIHGNDTQCRCKERWFNLARNDPSEPEPPDSAPSRSGRPRSTTHAELERIGIDLFVERGFAETSVDDIAAAAGISRRTFFRYFASKADVVWADFDAAVERLRADLDSMPADLDLMEALRRAVVRFNAVEPDQVAHHRRRMRLLLEVPDIIARSTLRYAQWRRVVDEFAAVRLDQDPEDLVPRTIGRCALGAALAAYEQWLRADDADLVQLLDDAFRHLATGFRAT